MTSLPDWRTWMLCSRKPGIGANILTPKFIKKYASETPTNVVFDIGGYPCRLPRYYTDKIFNEDQKEKVKILNYEYSKKMEKEWKLKYGKHWRLQYWLHSKQVERDISAHAKRLQNTSGFTGYSRNAELSALRQQKYSALIQHSQGFIRAEEET